jgi:hypothetical protein
MKHSFALITLAALAGCHMPTPVLEMPKPYQKGGVRVTLQEIYVSDHTAMGVQGVAENVGTETLKSVTVHLVVVDFHDIQVSDAIVTRAGFAPGEKWNFEAPFSSAYTDEFDRVLVDRVSVTK